MLKRLAIAGTVAFLAVGVAAAQESLTGIASVIDAEIFVIHGVRIRLGGIDAPEGDQLCTRSDGTPWRCGQRAAFELANRIGRKPVRCLVSGEDRYRRKLAACSQVDVELNRWLVANGWAVVYRKYTGAYPRDEGIAKRTGAGIWSGAFVLPWEWRRR